LVEEHDDRKLPGEELVGAKDEDGGDRERHRPGREGADGHRMQLQPIGHWFTLGPAAALLPQIPPTAWIGHGAARRAAGCLIEGATRGAGTPAPWRSVGRPATPWGLPGPSSSSSRSRGTPSYPRSSGCWRDRG